MGKKLAGLAVLGATILWAVLLWPEAAYRGPSMNDLHAHESLTYSILADWRGGGLGLDAWHDQCCLGSAPFRTYQPIGNLAAAGVTALFHLPHPGIALHWLMCLALVLQCLAFYMAARWLGLGLPESVAAAWLGPLVKSGAPFGLDFHSYVFTGAGLYTQALALPFLVLTVALGLRLCFEREKRGAVALGVAMSLTFAFHHLHGYLAALLLVPCGMVALAIGPQRRALLVQSSKAALIFVALNAYQLLSVLQDGPLLRRSEYGPETRWDGFGPSAVWQALRQNVFLDLNRWPAFGLLVVLGLVLLARKNTPRPARALPGMLALGLVLLCGRPLFGGVLDGIPGFREFMLERSVALIHLAAIFLGAIAVGALLRHKLTVPVVLLAVGYLVSERVEYLLDNQMHLERQAEADAKVDNLLLQSIPRDNLFVLRRDNETPSVGEVNYGQLASHLNVPQVSHSFYRGTYASESIRHFRFDNAEYYKFFDVGGLLIDDTWKVTPAFATKVHSCGNLSLYRTPADGPLSVIGVSVTAVGESKGYVPALSNFFFTPDFRANGTYPSAVPKPVAERWPQALPDATPGNPPAGGWGKVESWSHPRPGEYRAVLQAAAPGTYGMLMQSYHPRWDVRVNGRRVQPKWGTPGVLLFPLEPGRNEVSVRFSADPLRSGLFLFAVAAYLWLLARWAIARFASLASPAWKILPEAVITRSI